MPSLRFTWKAPWKGNRQALILGIVVLLRNPIRFIGLIFFWCRERALANSSQFPKTFPGIPVQLGLVLAFNALISVFVFKGTLSVRGTIRVMLIGIGVMMVAK